MSMKKIFTLVAAAAACSTVWADNVVKNLDNTLVIYTTSDTITTKQDWVLNEETFEEELQTVGKYWTGANMVDGFNACGLPLSGTSTTETQYKITTRKSYTDPETGFSMPAGSYRGVFVDDNLNLTGTLGSDKVAGYSNIKAVNLYFIPLPIYTSSERGISHLDYPTGRVQAAYYQKNDTGAYTKISNLCYREIHSNGLTNTIYSDGYDETTSTYANRVCTCPFYGYEAAVNEALPGGVDPLIVTVDQCYKVSVNLQNLKEGKDFEDIFENASTKQSEFANLVCDTTGGFESSMDYYFGKLEECCPYYEPDRMGYDCASGYDCYNQKWATKIAWDANTVVSIGIKKRMYLVGIALVSATEGAASKFMNADDKLSATWKDSDTAHGHYAEAEAIDGMKAEAQSAARTYNLAGQQQNAAKGLNIRNNKVIFIK